MSSLMSSHGMALATAMAVSGTVILMALCRHKPPLSTTTTTTTAARFAAIHPKLALRPCIITSEGERRKNHQKRMMMKKKKRVRFGEDIVVEFECMERSSSSSSEERAEVESVAVAAASSGGGGGGGGGGGEIVEVDSHHEVRHRGQEMPANRAALYNAILQDRLQRVASCC